jgi:hypothetical protein
MGLVEFASVCFVFGSRSEKRRNGERSNGHGQEQDERHHQGSPLVFAARPGEGMLNQGTDERLGAQRESLWRFPGVSRESEQEGSRRSRSKCLQEQAGLRLDLVTGQLVTGGTGPYQGNPARNGPRYGPHISTVPAPGERCLNWPPFRPDTRHSSEGLGQER